MSSSRARAAVLAFAATIALAFAASGFAREPHERAAGWPPLAGEPVWSLLAVGDTGAKPWPIARSRQQSMRVARALTAEDQRDPVDALVLLGDNFYPDGLHEGELEARVRGNLIEPFCRFLPSTEFSCPVASRSARVLAVLGNHDHKSAESPRLQRTEIGRRLPSWLLPASPAHALDLGQGVSIVLYDAVELLEAGSFEPLRAAIRATPGPWRILAGHFPLSDRARDREGRAAREAIEELGLPVQLHLAGHRHYLELAHSRMPPLLQVVAGSASNVRPLKAPLDGSVYQAERSGFARVDLVPGPDGDRLVVSLLTVADGFFARSRPARVTARWSVDRQGAARAEPLAAE